MSATVCIRRRLWYRALSGLEFEIMGVDGDLSDLVQMEVWDAGYRHEYLVCCRNIPRNLIQCGPGCHWIVLQSRCLDLQWEFHSGFKSARFRISAIISSQCWRRNGGSFKLSTA